MYNWRVLRILIVGKVTRCSVEVEFANMWSVDLGVSLLIELLGYKTL